jgi:hypothetical protein
MSTTTVAACAPIIVADRKRDGSAFIIETGNVAAGVIVRSAKSYRFFAAHEDFRTLDGADFTTPAAAQKAADLMHRASNPVLPRLPYGDPRDAARSRRPVPRG